MPKTGCVLAQDWMAPSDGGGRMSGESEGLTNGRGSVIVSLIFVQHDKVTPGSSVIIKNDTNLCLFEASNHIHMNKAQRIWTTHAQVGQEGSNRIS